MNYVSLILLCLLPVRPVEKHVYVSKNVEVSIFSSAPIEDIQASSARGVSVYNAQTGELDFLVPIRTFHFQSAKMEAHFNEDYMETDKYPSAVFKGKVSPVPPLSEGSYPVTASGILEVHGVKQTRTIPGTVRISNGRLNMNAEFTVRCGDHHIGIPQIVFYHIAEIIRVRVATDYSEVQTDASIH